jgi:hypothetical protein
VISMNDIFMAFMPIVNGLFILNPDESYVCNVSAKRPQLNDLSPT